MTESRIAALPTRILVVDDERNARQALSTLLREEGYDVSTASDGVEALERIADFSPAAILTDVRMPNMDGLTLMQKAREAGTDATFIVMTAFASVEAAVEAMRAGAENYLVKPLDLNAVLVVLEKALRRRELERETTQLRARVAERFTFENIVGTSGELQSVFDVVKQAASTRATVLILGESGTGKELIAQALHQNSNRKDKPFVKVHCAALSESLLESELFGHERGAFTGAVARREGRFEQAHGGTLFLDEIGEITPSVQVKLLRVLQQREFERVGGNQSVKIDVRIVAATNRDIVAEVKEGRFREDLYYRLNVVAVTLPPLRRRKSDIPLLMSHFLEKYGELHDKPIRGLAPGTMEALMAHDWPGNVRELENAIERAVVLSTSTELSADDLPPVMRGPRPDGVSADRLIPGASLARIEREAILSTLKMVEGSTSRAAEVLGISVRKIQYRLKEYGEGRLPGSEAEGEE